LGLTTYKLSTWEDGAVSGNKSSLRGKKSRFDDVQIEFVLNVYKRYAEKRQRVKIVAFMKHLKQQWQDQPWITPLPSRKTVEDMLLAGSCRKAKTKPAQKRNYHPAVKHFFPHAQAVLDGKEVIVSLGGQEFHFVMEFSKDMATDAIGGFAVGKTETAELVKKAFDNHSRNHQQPLAALIDNGSGNIKAAIHLGAEGVLIIKAHPYRAETKGQIEGEFGLFERKVSRIAIGGQNPEQQAMNILKKIAEVYLRLRNQTPRCSTCPFTPQTLMKAKPDSIAEEQAYKVLKAQQDLKREQQEQRLKIRAEFSDLLDNIVKEHQLSGDLLRLKKSMKWIEISTIKAAEQQFAVQSMRDTFVPAKRTMAYFYAIAKNMQLEKDQKRKEQTARRRYSLDQQAKAQRQEINLALEQQQRNQMLEKEPHVRVIQALKSHMTLPPAFRKTMTIFKNNMDEALLAIIRKKQQTRDKFIEKVHKGIMALSDLSYEARQQLIDQINQRITELSKTSKKVVTPI
jgi:hypothetical protein